MKKKNFAKNSTEAPICILLVLKIVIPFGCVYSVRK